MHSYEFSVKRDIARFEVNAYKSEDEENQIVEDFDIPPMNDDVRKRKLKEAEEQYGMAFPEPEYRHIVQPGAGEGEEEDGVKVPLIPAGMAKQMRNSFSQFESRLAFHDKHIQEWANGIVFGSAMLIATKTALMHPYYMFSDVVHHKSNAKDVATESDTETVNELYNDCVKKRVFTRETILSVCSGSFQRYKDTFLGSISEPMRVVEISNIGHFNTHKDEMTAIYKTYCYMSYLFFLVYLELMANFVSERYDSGCSCIDFPFEFCSEMEKSLSDGGGWGVFTKRVGLVMAFLFARRRFSQGSPLMISTYQHFYETNPLARAYFEVGVFHDIISGMATHFAPTCDYFRNDGLLLRHMKPKSVADMTKKAVEVAKEAFPTHFVLGYDSVLDFSKGYPNNTVPGAIVKSLLDRRSVPDYSKNGTVSAALFLVSYARMIAGGAKSVIVLNLDSMDQNAMSLTIMHHLKHTRAVVVPDKTVDEDRVLVFAYVLHHESLKIVPPHTYNKIIGAPRMTMARCLNRAKLYFKSEETPIVQTASAEIRDEIFSHMERDRDDVKKIAGLIMMALMRGASFESGFFFSHWCNKPIYRSFFENAIYVDIPIFWDEALIVRAEAEAEAEAGAEDEKQLGMEHTRGIEVDAMEFAIEKMQNPSELMMGVVVPNHFTDRQMAIVMRMIFPESTNERTMKDYADEDLPMAPTKADMMCFVYALVIHLRVTDETVNDTLRIMVAHAKENGDVDVSKYETPDELYSSLTKNNAETEASNPWRHYVDAYEVLTSYEYDKSAELPWFGGRTMSYRKLAYRIHAFRFTTNNINAVMRRIESISARRAFAAKYGNGGNTDQYKFINDTSIYTPYSRGPGFIQITKKSNKK